jgi:serine/threonine-protein kinase
MKLIRGPSLNGLLAKNEHHRLQERIAIPIAGDILEALDYAHRRGIFHRDVKPSNVLLEEDNRALLIDFGIAVAVGEERRTRTGVVVGTPLYMSPEQITRPKNIDHRSDVYSVGCLIYEMLTGQTPFVKGQDGVGHTDFEIQQAHVNKKPLNPQKRVPGISAHLSEIVMKALEKKPDSRIPGCQEFIRLLDLAGKYPNGGQDVINLADDKIRNRNIKLLTGLLVALLFGFIVLMFVLNL